MEKLRLLQISDIHWQKKYDLDDDYSDIREGMLNDLRNYMINNKRGFDKILICGDIAFSGQKEEYKRAEKFIDQLCCITGCSAHEVYTVPGNHDKNLKLQFKTTREIINYGFDCGLKNGSNDERWSNMLRNEYAIVKLLYKPFENYYHFASSNFDSGETTMANALDLKHEIFSEDEDKMYWRSDGDDLSGYNIVFYGVNTALMSDLNDYDPGVKDDGHKLFLSKMAYKAGVINKNKTINILMAHHPVKFLMSANSIQEDLDKRYHVQFYGHVHIDDSDCKNGAVHVYSGALNPGDINDKKYEPIYNIVELWIKHDKQADYLHVNLMVRHWNGYNFEGKNNLSFTIPIKNHDTWKESNKAQPVQLLPNDVTKRDIRMQFKCSPKQDDIVEKMYPHKYGDQMVTYTRNQLFLEQVRIDDKWNELYNLIIHDD